MSLPPLPEVVTSFPTPNAPHPPRLRDEATVLRGLLGHRAFAHPLEIHDGQARYYKTARFRPTAEDWSLHLRGEKTFALECIDENRKSRILVFDVDELAQVRLSLLADAARLNGVMPDAVRATDGSAAGRGKLVIFFAAPQPRMALMTLGETIRAKARCQSQWGLYDSKDASIYPQGASGGVIRLAGRQPARNGPVERFFDPMTGEVGLASVVPSPLRLARSAVPVAKANVLPFVERWLTEGLTFSDKGMLGVLRNLQRLAREVHRLHGPIAGRDVYYNLLRRIEAASPGLKAPSPTTGDRRNVFKRAPAFWEYVVKNQGSQCYNTLPPPVSSPKGDDECIVTSLLSQPERDMLNLLGEFVERRGLNPLAFSLSYRDLGEHRGREPMTVWREINALTKKGAVIILDRGTPGPHGLPTIYCLVQASESQRM